MGGQDEGVRRRGGSSGPSPDAPRRDASAGRIPTSWQVDLELTRDLGGLASVAPPELASAAACLEILLATARMSGRFPANGVCVTIFAPLLLGTDDARRLKVRVGPETLELCAVHAASGELTGGCHASLTATALSPSSAWVMPTELDGLCSREQVTEGLAASVKSPLTKLALGSAGAVAVLARSVASEGSVLPPIAWTGVLHGARLLWPTWLGKGRSALLHVQRIGRVALVQPGLVPTVVWYRPRVDSTGRVVAIDAALVAANGSMVAVLEAIELGAERTEALDDLLPRFEAVAARVFAGLLAGPSDNLLALGASSLDLVRFCCAVQAELGVRLDHAALLRHPTIEHAHQLAIASTERGDRPSLASLRSGPGESNDGLHPLSYAQEAIWIAGMLAEGTSAFVDVAAWRLVGRLDVAALARSLRALTARHESLRTSIVDTEAGLRQRVLPIAPEVQLHRSAGTFAEASIAELAARVRPLTRLFAREGAPLFAAHLLSDGDCHVLVFVAHHAVCDGLGLRSLLLQLSDAYAAETSSSGQALLLPSSAQQRDIGVWDHEPARLADQDQAVARWVESIGSATSACPVPPDFQAPVALGFAGRRQELRTDVLVDAVTAFARAERTTVFVALLAAFRALLLRYQPPGDEPMIAIPIGNRGLPELQDAVGCFVNTVPLVVRADGGPSFRELVQRTHEAVAGVLAEQFWPFELAARRMRASQDKDFRLSVGFSLLETPLPKLGDVIAEPIPVDLGVARSDLIMQVAMDGHSVQGWLEYRTDLYAQETIERFSRYYGRLLAACLAAPERSIVAHSITSSADAAEVARHCVGAVDVTVQPTVLQQFRNQAAHHGSSAAVVSADGDVTTYVELARRAVGLARRLRGVGVAPDAIVLLMLPRGVDLAVGMLAVLEVGACFVPVDPETPAARLTAAVREAGIGYAVIAPDPCEPPCLPGCTAVRVDAPPADDPLRTASVHRGPTDLAYGVFTSGSTGTPKLVLLEHGGLANFAEQRRQILGVRKGDRVLHVASPSFDACVGDVVEALTSGATLHCAPADASFGGEALANFARAASITVATLTPSVLATLPAEPLPALRMLAVAGERCSAALVNRWAVGRRFFNLYGPAEATIWATADECRPGEVPTLGWPIGNVRAYVVDSQLHTLPFCVPGEIAIGGVGVGRGYAVAPPAARARFSADPQTSAAEGRLYLTGDRGLMQPDGRIRFLGRLDDEVKLRGVRIQPGDVEHALVEQPHVRSAAVVLNGQGAEAKLVAFVELDAEEPEAAIRLHAALRLVLPRALRPSAIETLHRLPRLPGGKIDRRTLRAVGVTLRNHTEQKAPLQSWAQERVAEAFCRVLRLEPDRGIVVGRHHDFFELGGHSLLVVRLLSELRTTTGVQLRLCDVMGLGTVARIASLIENPSASSPIDEHVAIRADVRRTDFGEPIRHAPRRPDTILVTGATGFLGAHVASRLASQGARVLCLVRACTEEEAHGRLAAHFAGLGLDVAQVGRLGVVLGDVRREGLGATGATRAILEREVDAVVHSAAEISLVASYSRLRPTNVEGTVQVLRLCAVGRAKTLHYVSTLSVMLPRERSDADPIAEVDAGDPTKLPIGYAQSKCVAEHLVRSARAGGLCCVVYRPTRMWASESGVLASDDLLVRFLRGCVELGAAPDVDFCDNLVPVDQAARVIVEGVWRDARSPQYVHIASRRRTHLRHLLAALQRLGHGIAVVSHDEWLSRIDRSQALAPLADFLRGERPLEWRCPDVSVDASTEVLGESAGCLADVDERSIAQLLRVQGLLPR
jgi:amino acid adenylation domain-containing protein/thioester reductase-like protein